MATKEKRPASSGTPRRRGTPSRGHSAPVKRSGGTGRSHETTHRHPSQQTPRRRLSRSRAESQVVYSPPKTFNKLRFLLGLATAAAVVLALILGMSIFFKVEHINVAGMYKYTAWDVREASDIQEGDNLMTLSKAKVSGKIIANLPYVDQVRIGIKLPDTVNIEISELEVVYAIQADDNSWWLINAQGRALEKISGIAAEAYTIISGVYIQATQPGMQAIASAGPSETQPLEGMGETIEAITPLNTVDPAQQLSTALNIVQLLEENGVIGLADVVNVANLFEIQIEYDGRYQVLLGESTQLNYKIRAMVQAVAQMTDYQQGTLDVSFTVWPDKVGYTPYAE